MSSTAWPRILQGGLQGFVTRGRAPLGVSWIVTNRCNLRCVYCACPDIKTKELNTAQALDVIEDMAQMGTARVHLTGGEPLVRKDIGTLIDRMRFFDMRVSMSSNGTLVPRRKRVLRGLRSVSFSLDGPPEIHDTNRADGSVADVLRALDTLIALDVRRFITCLITRTTDEACLDFVLKVAQEHGAEVFFQPALDVVLATDMNNPVVADSVHVRRVLAAVLERRQAGEPVGNSVGGLRDLMTWPKPRSLRCGVNRVAVRITPEGILLPCHERASAPDGESVLQGGFAAAFKRLRLKQCTECWGAGRTEMRTAIRRGLVGEFIRS